MNKFKALLLPCVSRQKQIQKNGLKQKKKFTRVTAFPFLRKLSFNQVRIQASNFKTKSYILRKFCSFRKYYFSSNRKIYLLNKIRFIFLKKESFHFLGRIISQKRLIFTKIFFPKFYFQSWRVSTKKSYFFKK